MNQILSIHVKAFTERYLGFPMIVGQVTSGTFDHIGERSLGKMQGWSERNLAWASREVLLKSVFSGHPIIYHELLQLTKKVCRQSTSSMAKILVGQLHQKKSLQWLSCEKLVALKGKGGMDFRDFEKKSI